MECECVLEESSSTYKNAHSFQEISFDIFYILCVMLSWNVFVWALLFVCVSASETKMLETGVFGYASYSLLMFPFSFYLFFLKEENVFSVSV